MTLIYFISDCKVNEKLDGFHHQLIRFSIKTDFTLTDNSTEMPDYIEKLTSATSSCQEPTEPQYCRNSLDKLQEQISGSREGRNLLEIRESKWCHKPIIYEGRRRKKNLERNYYLIN